MTGFAATASLLYYILSDFLFLFIITHEYFMKFSYKMDYGLLRFARNDEAAVWIVATQ